MSPVDDPRPVGSLAAPYEPGCDVTARQCGTRIKDGALSRTEVLQAGCELGTCPVH